MEVTSNSRGAEHPCFAALRSHWPEYLMEAAELGMFMVSACVVGVLLGHPASFNRLSPTRSGGWFWAASRWV
jgi:hypothetical protein